MVANRSVALVMWLNLSLVFTCLLRNLIHNRFIDVKFVDVAVFHVLMLNIMIIWLIFLLDIYHFLLYFNFIFCFNNRLKFLCHISRVFTFQQLLIYLLRDEHFVSEMVIWVVSLFVDAAVSCLELLLINFNFCWILRVCTTQFSCISIEIVVQHT